jgi:hypothetical protein
MSAIAIAVAVVVVTVRAVGVAGSTACAVAEGDGGMEKPEVKRRVTLSGHGFRNKADAEMT